MTNPKDSTRTGGDRQAPPVRASSGAAFSSRSPEPIDRPSSPKLLAVDCGLRTGLALYTLSGNLLWYRSHNLGNRQRLKKAVWQILNDIDGLTRLVIEGGGPLSAIWARAGEKLGLTVRVVYAEQWRRELLLPRQQRSGKQAKQVAAELAREIVARSAAEQPTTLRHDAAEAILVGWWACRGPAGEEPVIGD